MQKIQEIEGGSGGKGSDGTRGQEEDKRDKEGFVLVILGSLRKLHRKIDRSPFSKKVADKRGGSSKKTALVFRKKRHPFFGKRWRINIRLATKNILKSSPRDVFSWSLF